jgi:two-component system chemotaxis response regulator CheY
MQLQFSLSNVEALGGGFMARILVVDDDPVLQRMMEAVLGKEGHAVVVAENGYAALEKLSREVFQLIISDANMPGGLNGFSLVAAIKQDKTLRHIPVLFLTGRSRKDDVVKALNSGVSDYLIKPVNHQVIVQKVATLLMGAVSAKPLVPGDVAAGGVAELQMRVIDLSEQEVEFFSPVAFPNDFNLRLFSSLFESAGLTQPRLKIKSCAPFKEGDEAFRVIASFVALTATEQTSLHTWLQGQQGLAS